jgi:long-chain acyl-CoA synthetase
MLDLGFLSREFGSRASIQDPEGVTTYEDLVEQVFATVSWLERLGVEPGERVAVVCDQDRATVVRTLALMERGCTLLPLDPQLGEEEVLERCLAFGAHRLSKADGAPEMLAPFGQSVSTHATKQQERPVMGLLSSGSTGTPKIALRTAAQLRACVAVHARRMDLRPSDRVIAVVPIAFTYGFHNVLLATLSRGACIVFPSSRHPRTVLGEIGSQRVTVLGSTPVFFDLMVRFGAGAVAEFERVRVAIAVGDALSTRVQRSFAEAFGKIIWNGYGTSETGPVLINSTGAVDEEAVALGRPYPGVHVTLRDKDDRPVPEGETGEIVVQSPGCAYGYVGGQEGARPFDGGRFFTGDLAVERDGVFYFAGRSKQLINTAGRKVDPVEVEHVLLRHPKVKDAAVLGQRDGDRELVKAVIVSDVPLTGVELVEFCAQSLAAYKVPRVVEFRSSLARNANAKLLRGRL